MSQPDGDRASRPSPYLSLREAVRPAIAAYSVLAREHERSAALAEECDNLLKLTRDLLEAAGLVRLLSPEPTRQISGAQAGGQQACLANAYADVGMLWAKIIGSLVALAGHLVEQQRWEEAQYLASLVENGGEIEPANALRQRIDEARASLPRRQIAACHTHMSEEEIGQAIETLCGLSKDFPKRKLQIARVLAPISVSMVRLYGSGSNNRGADYISQSRCPEHMADKYLLDIYTDFVKLRGTTKRPAG